MYQWIKSLFAREPTSEEEEALKELENRIRVYKRVVAIRLSIFEDKHGRLSRSQRNYIAMKIEKRISKMRANYLKKFQK